MPHKKKILLPKPMFKEFPWYTSVLYSHFGVTTVLYLAVVNQFYHVLRRFCTRTHVIMLCCKLSYLRSVPHVVIDHAALERTSLFYEQKGESFQRLQILQNHVSGNYFVRTNLFRSHRISHLCGCNLSV